jgi:hypothetical protein
MSETEEISLVREVLDIWIKLMIKHLIYTTAPCWFVHIPPPPNDSSETLFSYILTGCARE